VGGALIAGRYTPPIDGRTLDELLLDPEKLGTLELAAILEPVGVDHARGLVALGDPGEESLLDRISREVRRQRPLGRRLEVVAVDHDQEVASYPLPAGASTARGSASPIPASLRPPLEIDRAEIPARRALAGGKAFL